MEGRDIVGFTGATSKTIITMLNDHNKLWLGDKVTLLEMLRSVIKVVDDKAII